GPRISLPEADESLQPTWDIDVLAAVEPQLGHRRLHAIRLLRLDRDRRARAARDRELAQLGHRAGDGVVPAYLVHIDRMQVGVRVDQLAPKQIERVLAPIERRGLDAEGGPDGAHGGGGEWKLGLHDGPPLLEPSVVDTLELLDVHQAVAHLDRGI